MVEQGRKATTRTIQIRCDSISGPDRKSNNFLSSSEVVPQVWRYNHPLNLLPFTPKLASRYYNTARGSIKNVTPRQTQLSPEHSQAYSHLLPAPGRRSNDTFSILGSSKSLSCRRSSYLEIRNFFINSSAQYRQPRCTSSLSQRCRFSTTGPSIIQPSDFIGEAEINHLIAREDQWPESRALNARFYSASSIGTPRYDWRSRAFSRTRLAMAGEYYDGPDLNIRRIAPPQVPVQMGEPFSEEIQKYADRYVA
jgi:hypothetical protein